MDGEATVDVLEDEIKSETLMAIADDHDDAATAPTVVTQPALTGVVGDYRIHDVTEVIPTLKGDEFEEFVRELAEKGQREVVVIDGSVIIEGVDTVRAIGVLKARGVDIELQTVPWQPRPGQTVGEFLVHKLLKGPRFTVAQRAQIAADLLYFIEKEKAEAQAAARIKPGEVRNPRGINKRKADPKSGDETHPSADKKVKNKAKLDRSTYGVLAEMAEVTTYAAKQAVKIKRLASQESIAAIKDGTKKPKDVVAEFEEPMRKQKADAKKAKPIDHPFKPTTPLQHDLLTGWVHLRDNKAAVVERQQARDDMRAFFEAEETAEQRASKPTEGGGQ